jgi:uncharacterized membrane protein
MEKVVFVSFEKEKQADDGAWALCELHHVDGITLYWSAVIAKGSDGKIIVRQHTVEHPNATVGGLLIHSLLGLFGPAAVAVDPGSGALLGAAIEAAKAGITTQFIRSIQNELASGKTGIIAEVDEEWESPLDARMEALGGTVFRQTRIQLEDAFFEKEIEAQQAELAKLESEKLANAEAKEKQKSAERNAKLQAKIDATRRKIQQKEEQLNERIQSVTDEGEGKVALIQGQKTNANEEAQAQLDRRLKNIRAEYQSRAKKLAQALEQCKKAHAAHAG